MNRIILINCCLLLVLSLQAQAESMPRSLFFTTEEQASIDYAVTQQPTAVNPAYVIRLKAIMYIAPDRWTVWLQDKTFRPDTRDERITITNVTPNEATIKVTLPLTGGTKSVTLQPNQSYDLLSNAIGF